MFKIYKIKVTLKSGRVIKARCRDVNVIVNNNQINRISVKEDDGRWPNFIRLDEIDAVNLNVTLYGKLMALITGLPNS